LTFLAQVADQSGFLGVCEMVEQEGICSANGRSHVRSKLLIAADAAHAASVFGVEANPQIDGRAVLKRLRTKRDESLNGSRAADTRKRCR